ncbi:unnamed protein product, partial [Mesorhabditis belari]|uniref:Thioredoxin-like fold domain-containing protein n=1 Tax=Mesorhabditis belari TaxID=2138241 RepID=A0AAF3FPT2_9BILA
MRTVNGSMLFFSHHFSLSSFIGRVCRLSCCANVLSNGRTSVSASTTTKCGFHLAHRESTILKLNNVLVAEFPGIVDFVAQKGVKLSAHLTEVQLAEMMAHMSMIDLLLRNIEIYVVWRHDETFSKIYLISSRVSVPLASHSHFAKIGNDER